MTAQKTDVLLGKKIFIDMDDDTVDWIQNQVTNAAVPTDFPTEVCLKVVINPDINTTDNLKEIEVIQLDDHSEESRDSPNGTQFEILHKKLFICKGKDCSKAYLSKKRLLKHKNRHLKRYKCNIDKCYYKGRKNSHLIQHMRDKHLNDTQLEDEFLDISVQNKKLSDNSQKMYSKAYKTLHSVSKLSKQIKSSNNISEKHTESQRNVNLNKEIELIQLDDDSEETINIDDVCALRIPNEFVPTYSNLRENELNLHRISENHSNECETQTKRSCDESPKNLKNLKGKYVCDYNGCGKHLISGLTLRRHKERHSAVEYKCYLEDCSALFKNHQIFRRHLIQHLMNYRCNWKGCQYRTPSATNFKTHRSSHLGNKLFVCLVCHKWFYKAILLKEHKSVHKMFAQNINNKKSGNCIEDSVAEQY